MRALSLIVALFVTWPVSASAVTRVAYPGGWYCEAQPGGAIVADIRGSHYETRTGRVEYPSNGEALYVRLRADGGAFVGQGATDGQAWEFIGGAWRSADSLAFGVSPVIYDRGGNLVVSHGGSVGSQGFRFVDENGRIWTGDETYADPARHLWEWTARPAARCGQGGDEEGLQCVLASGRRVRVEPGINRFVRFNQVGDQLAFCTAKFTERQAVAIWMSVAELNALPTYHIPSHDPGDDPDVEPPPPQLTLQATNEKATVERVIRAHPEIDTTIDDDVVRGRILDYVLAELDSPPWGRKARNKDGSRKNGDALVYLRTDGRYEIYDVISGGSGQAAWIKPTKTLAPGENGYWAPADPLPTEPEPDDPDPEPEPDLSALIARITALEAKVTALEQRLTNGVPKEQVLSLIEAALVDLRVTGRSQPSGWGPFGHTHQIELRVVR